MNTDKSETPFHETFLGSDTETKQEQYDSDCPFGEGGFSPSSAPPMPEDSSVPSYLKISDENVQDVLFEEPVAEPAEEQKSDLLKSDYKIVNGVIVHIPSGTGIWNYKIRNDIGLYVRILPSDEKI